MEDYIKNWNKIISNCSFDNTYKMAWAKAIVETAISKDIDSALIISFEEIAELFLKYYWNQTIYFNLTQGSSLKKIPEALKYTKNLIDLYYAKKGDYFPQRYEKIIFEDFGIESEKNKTIKKIVKTLGQDVSWRFMNLSGETYPLYELVENQVVLSLENAKLLKKYSDFLFPMINYRWTQMLESFNHSPRISSKVRAIDEDSIKKRNNLNKFREFLDLEFSDNKRYCFYCGKEIVDDDLTIDHVIPWSFMYSDDIWNLVYCHRSENSSKSNRIPEETDVKALECRNKLLLEKLTENKISSKRVDELQLAIEKDYVKKFWISSRG
ncbi:HNH endonuclease domain-containing protein [Methanococcus maripaludis]|uniref:HNH endonuclease:HNH nuclease n=1 Tax=Methanococcus maripaludis (strain DSM 14266 / JCM 13030 / NBRC 101832 / S2 / LL) TaxID=267377 RepID=Q6LZ71_METMP|nr:HNH endonuclease domain-containing protein [Methanococcus maripaludis]CAF30314.1 HNH endonuclease:HNH nuclease [Methanococcus maripaludis S2]